MYLGSLLLRERREKEERDRAEEGTGGRGKGERGGREGRTGKGRREEGRGREEEERAAATLWHGAPQCLNPALHMRDFILVINSNLPPILHRFLGKVQYRYIFLPLFGLTPRRRGSFGTISVKFYLDVVRSPTY